MQSLSHSWLRRLPEPPVRMLLAALLWLLPMAGHAAPRQVLHGHVPKVVPSLAPVGRLPATQHLHLAIGLPLRNQQALNDLLHKLYDPASPVYRHFLTPAQVSAQFGPTVQDYEAVAAFANARGLKVTNRYSNRALLDVEGSVSDIEKTLHVTMRVYRHPTEKRTFYAPDTEPSLDLAVPLSHISGLDNYSIPHPNLVAKPAGLMANATPSSGQGPSGTYAGSDFRAAYVPGVSLTGSGQSIGLLQFDGYYASDIAAYRTQFGLPNIPLVNVAVDGGVSTPGSGNAEVCLDIEMSMSMAPGLSTIYVYEAPNETGLWVDLLNRMASDNLAKQLSCSWSGGGPNSGGESAFEQMALQGQSFFNATGDSDAFTGAISFPSDSPHITEVGATTLTTTGSAGSYVSETVWNWGDDGGTYVGSSGGVSTYYSIPSWQQGVSMAANGGSTTMRNVPDVAMVGDNVYVRYNNGGSGDFGGTSCAAPLWAAFTALVNQEAVANGIGTVGFLDPAVYAIGASSSYGSDFHDITTGNNTSASSPNEFYAVPGYDLCDGWGTPAGGALINALALPSETLQISNSNFASSGVAGGPFSPGTNSYTLINSGSSAVTWSASVNQGWLSLSATSGTLAASGSTSVTASINANANALAGGAYSGAISFTDSGTGYSQNKAVSLSVIATPVITSVLTATASNGSAFSYQIAASNTPTSYGASGLPSGLTVSSTSGLISGTTTATGTSSVTLSASNLAGTGTATLKITVLPPKPVITSSLTATATTGAGFSYSITASNSPSSYAAKGLPSGLGVNTTTGIISGTATATGTSNVTISATNAGGTGSATLKITVVPPVPVISSTLAATATNGVAFSYSIAASNSPSSYAATGLPSGLGVNTATGLISGTATVTGTSNVTISAINLGGTGSALLVLTVLPPPPVITSGLAATAYVGTSFNYSITASNNAGSYNAMGLPAGLSVNTASGLISGTATASGTSNVTLSAGNAGGTGTAILVLTVIGAPPPVILSGSLTTLCSFTGTSGAYPGSYPAAGLVQINGGPFYGTTGYGGSANDGTLFEITTQGAFTSLYSLTGTAGAYPGAVPAGPLVQINGTFYGTAEWGGSSNDGVMFGIPGGVWNSGALFSFTGTNGANPGAGLVEGSDGNFYGTTESGGGASGGGTAFMITSSGSLATLCSFTGSNGFQPAAPLVQGTNGNFYGTTASGGSANLGAAFMVTSSGSLTTLCSFTGTNGSHPLGGLIQGSSGNFYGTTSQGGSAGDGTVFQLTSSGTLTTLCSFTGTSGANPGQSPEASLVQGSDGNLYGTTYTGGSGNYGTLFKITTSGALTPLYLFTDGTDGGYPVSSLVQGSDGNFYGTALGGGANNLGTVFQWIPSSVIYATAGSAFSYQINATNNPASYGATGLPAGLNVNAATGLISGTATASGTSTVTLSASNIGGTGTAALTIAMQPSPFPSITSGTSATATEGQPFTYQITATNSPASYAATGLPAGLNVDPVLGSISGTATATGTSSVTISAINASGTGSALLTVVVQAPYTAWQSQVFSAAQLANPAISAETAAPAGDGVSNLMKYALNLNPLTPATSGLPAGFIATTGSGNYLSLTYTQVLSATDITYTVQVSSDLHTWNSGPGYTALAGAVNNPGGLTESVTVQDATPLTPTTPPQFIRLQVTGQ